MDDRGVPVRTKYFVCCVSWSKKKEQYKYKLKLEPFGKEWIKRGKNKWFYEKDLDKYEATSSGQGGYV